MSFSKGKKFTVISLDILQEFWNSINLAVRIDYELFATKLTVLSIHFKFRLTSILRLFRKPAVYRKQFLHFEQGSEVSPQVTDSDMYIVTFLNKSHHQ